MSDQVKSKQRVTDHGEVFTAEREVNAMLDLVKQETERIDSRFLEPACGDGNFLAEILRRKLAVVKRKYKKSPLDYEKNAVLAATSIYGVDILQDNVEACRQRMFEIWDNEYQAVLKNEVNEDCRAAVRFIFSRNIVCGNALKGGLAAQLIRELAPQRANDRAVGLGYRVAGGNLVAHQHHAPAQADGGDAHGNSHKNRTCISAWWILDVANSWLRSGRNCDHCRAHDRFVFEANNRSDDASCGLRG